MLALKNSVSTFLKSEYSLISGHDDVSAIIVTRLICDFQRMCFIKPSTLAYGQVAIPYRCRLCSRVMPGTI